MTQTGSILYLDMSVASKYQLDLQVEVENSCLLSKMVKQLHFVHRPHDSGECCNVMWIFLHSCAGTQNQIGTGSVVWDPRCS